MSKERARRRALRERETAARAAQRERRERRAARIRGARRVLTRRLPRPARAGRQTGVLARRRRTRAGLLVTALLAVQVLVWVLRPDWQARLGALVVTLLVAPMLAALLT